MVWPFSMQMRQLELEEEDLLLMVLALLPSHTAITDHLHMVISSLRANDIAQMTLL
jgi:hypothetical protein